MLNTHAILENVLRGKNVLRERIHFSLLILKEEQRLSMLRNNNISFTKREIIQKHM